MVVVVVGEGGVMIQKVTVFTGLSKHSFEFGRKSRGENKNRHFFFRYIFERFFVYMTGFLRFSPGGNSIEKTCGYFVRLNQKFLYILFFAREPKLLT